ncbi:MAG: hypothetical protein UY50_C0024G0017 [Parcubacteria group bacterium GW2011_GWA2_49_9]|nr:MAG: hypothetical protein UY50_C0024G0017 [Parcubacteria group bacterium GW2011_GWA2_49_9]
MIKYAIGQVRQLVIIITVPNSLTGGHTVIINYTNTVPTFAEMKALVEVEIAKFEVTSAQAIKVAGVFRDDSYHNPKIYSPDMGVLFQGSTFASPLSESGNGSVMWEADAEIIMRLSDTIPVRIEGLKSAQLITYQEDDVPRSRPLDIDLDGRLMLPTQLSGEQEIIYRAPSDVGNYTTAAFSLVTGQRIPIRQITVRALVFTPDVLSFKNKTSVEVIIPTWEGYGIIPLVELIYDKENVTSRVEVSISTYDGAPPPTPALKVRGFWIENAQTHERGYITIHPEEKSVILEKVLPGVYWVELDIDVNEGGAGDGSGG